MDFIGRAMDSIAVEKHQAVPFLAAFAVVLRCRMPKAMHAMRDHLERRFAEFAGVPYLDPLNRQEWEDLWETEEKREPLVDRN